MDFQEIEVLSISGIEYLIVILNLYIKGQMYQPKNIFSALDSFRFLEKKVLRKIYKSGTLLTQLTRNFPHICVNRPKISVRGN